MLVTKLHVGSPFTLTPVLTQWVVYAIRNLTEDNIQNQDLIAKMEDQGLADASLLKKMGFEVEKRGDKLILKPVNDAPQRYVVSTSPPALLPLAFSHLRTILPTGEVPHCPSAAVQVAGTPTLPELLSRVQGTHTVLLESDPPLTVHSLLLWQHRLNVVPTGSLRW